VWQCFEEFDTDGSGSIDSKDLAKILAQCGIDSEEDQKKIIEVSRNMIQAQKS
jgi:Ca2+-binding EF-hand superfamily protein